MRKLMKSYENNSVHSDDVISARHKAVHSERIARRRKVGVATIASIATVAIFGPGTIANNIRDTFRNGPDCNGLQTLAVKDNDTRLQDLKVSNIENTGNDQLDVASIDVTIERPSPGGTPEIYSHGPLKEGDRVTLPISCN